MAEEELLMPRHKIVYTFLALAFIIGCAGPKGLSPSSKRSFALQMHNDTLSELYSKRPLSKSQVQNSVGYAVFSNISTQVIFFGGGSGYGVAVDKSTAKKTYMRMAEATAGIGVGLKDFREIIIFNNSGAFRNFIVHGWDFGAEAAAGAKSGEKGGEATATDSLVFDVVVYRLTEAGVELKTNVSGKKYWLDDELNYYQ